MSTYKISAPSASRKASAAADGRLIVALDLSGAAETRDILAKLGGLVETYKVGMQLFTAEGPKMVGEVINSGRRVFLDLKYHDIPNTVGAAVREAARYGVSMLTVHASGGRKMLQAAVEAAGVAGQGSVKVLAVTVLTSLDEADLLQTGVTGTLRDQVLRLAAMAREAGCAGVVSSAREARMIRDRMGDDFLIVTPGVRPAGASHGDQARVVTPADAIAAGASHIVVGRPVTAATDPAAAARAIIEEIGIEQIRRG